MISSSSGSSSAAAASEISCATPSPTTSRASADAVAVGQLGAQLAAGAVQVAVQPAPRREGDGVDDRRVRVLGPRRAREVQRLLARQLLGAALGRRLAQVGVDLLLREPLELPVVAEEALALRRAIATRPGRRTLDEPGPLMTMNQNAKIDAQMIAVIANTRPMHARALVDPGGAAHEDPRAVDALEHHQAAEQHRDHHGEGDEDREADVVGPVLDARGDPQRAGRDRAPEQQRDEDLEREQQVREPAVDALARRPSRAPGRARYFVGAVPGGGRRTARRCRWDPCASFGSSTSDCRRCPARVRLGARRLAVEPVEERQRTSR